MIEFTRNGVEEFGKAGLIITMDYQMDELTHVGTGVDGEIAFFGPHSRGYTCYLFQSHGQLDRYVIARGEGKFEWGTSPDEFFFSSDDVRQPQHVQGDVDGDVFSITTCKTFL